MYLENIGYIRHVCVYPPPGITRWIILTGLLTSGLHICVA